MGQVKLTGNKKFITANPDELFLVKEGSVLVYVVCVSSGRMLRSVFLRSCNVDDKIPTLSAMGDNGRSYHLLMLGDTAAEIEIVKISSDEDRANARAEFLKSEQLAENIDADNFSENLVNYYNSKLFGETTLINNLREERAKVVERKNRLFMSMFENDRLLNLEVGSESMLYDAAAMYCKAKKIDICSYQTLSDAYGSDFDIMDIARASDFVCRKITLSSDWYRKSGDSFIGFNKTDNTPIICVAHSNSTYSMYDFKTGIDYTVGYSEAGIFSDEAYVFYDHLPGKSLTMWEVMKFGMGKFKKADIRTYIILFIVTTLVGLLLPLLNEKVYDTLIPLGRLESIVQVGGVIFACMIGNAFFDVVKNLCSFRSIKLMEYSIISATYERIFKLPQKFIDNFGTMELVNRVNSISGIFSSTLNSGAAAVIGAVLGLFYLWRMFLESPPLAWRALILAVISALVMYAFGKVRVLKERERLKAQNKANGMLYGFVAGILKIKVSGSESRSLYEYEKVNTESIAYDVRSTRITNISNVFSSVISMFCTGFIYYTIVKKKQTLTIGDYAAFNSAYGLFQSAINKLVSFFLTLAGLVPVMERIQPIYEQEVECKGMPSPIKKLSGDIDVIDLSFSYDKDEAQVLSDINMHIEKGEFIGIVGPTGCGKSTLLKCLLGFESPDSGKVVYDGRELINYDATELRRRIGTVLQDGKLLTGNIFSNVTLSSPNLNAEGVEELLKEVGLYEDVSKMPMGIYTAVSEGGGTVSGGQAQRILIARALANKPDIVFFDEATSALDNITQQKVCESLEKRNITRIMIAHRLSTVVNCDRIYVLDKGKIVESGNYSELMENKGLFYELAKRQKVSI